MSSAPPSLNPFNIVTEGPIRRAVAIVDRCGNDLAAALRRSAPFLVRRGVAVTPDPAEPSTQLQAQASLEAPTFLAQFTTEPGGVRGALLFDGPLVAFLLDGLLGGDGATVPPINLESLTAPQRILMGRLADGVLQGLSPVLHGAAGFRLRRLAVVDDASLEVAAVGKTFRFGDGGANGAAMLLVGNDALAGAAEQTPEAAPIDPRVALSLGSAEIELVAELGRVKMTLGDLSALRVGHVLRTKVPVGGRVHVRVEDQILFEGYPITAGTQIAIRLEGGTPLDDGVGRTRETERDT